MSPETLKNYIETFRQNYPALFKDAETEQAFTAAMDEAGRELSTDIRDLITDRIGQAISDFARYDLDVLAQEGVPSDALAQMKNDPVGFTGDLLIGTWETSMSIVEMVGFGGIDIQKLIADKRAARGLTEEDVAFTSREVGQA